MNVFEFCSAKANLTNALLCSLRYLGWPEMLGATLLYVSYNTFMIKKDLEVKALPIRIASLRSCMSF